MGGKSRCNSLGCNFFFNSDPVSCPDKVVFQNLTKPPVLDEIQKRRLEEEFKGINTDSYARVLIKEAFLLRPEVLRTNLIKDIAISLLADNETVRARVVEDLLLARQYPEVKKFLGEIAKSYSIPAIMERSAQILAAPDLPEECDSSTSYHGHGVQLLCGAIL